MCIRDRGCAALEEAVRAAVASMAGDFRARLVAVEAQIAQPYRGAAIRVLKGQPLDEALFRALAWTVQNDPGRLSEDWTTIRIDP